MTGPRRGRSASRAFPGEGGGRPTAVGGSLYFYADDGVHGTELWTSDGTEQGTRLVDDICRGRRARSRSHGMPESFAVLDDALLFVAEEPAITARVLADGRQRVGDAPRA